MKSGFARIEVLALLLAAWSTTVLCQQHFKFTANTSNNASIAIPVYINPTIAGNSLTPGDEIGVFTPSALCVGAVVWTDSNAALTVWGDDGLTSEVDGIRPGETMQFRVWDSLAGEEYVHVNVSYSQGDSTYVQNGIYALSSLDAALTSVMENPIPPLTYQLSQNYPNPFNPTTMVAYRLPQRSTVSLNVYSLSGARVKSVVKGEQEAGCYSVVFDGTELANGAYFYRLEAIPMEGSGKASFSETKKFVLLK